MSFAKYLRVAMTVLITCTLLFSNTYVAGVAEDYYNELAWSYGWEEYAIPFTELGFQNWGWSNGPFSEGTYTMDLFAGANGNVLENGGIAGEVTVIYDEGEVEVNCRVFEDFYTLEEVYLWIGETELPPSSSGQFWYNFTHELNTSYSFTGDVYIALCAEVTVNPLVGLYGAEAANTTGNPIGGGNGYTDIISINNPDVEYIVDTQSELLSALENAIAGDIIYVEGNANIGMGNLSYVQIPAGVTLASNRGENDALGGRIYTTKRGKTLFYVVGENVRITGLRIEGPDTGTNYVSNLNVAIQSSFFRNLEVDNCEIYGWSHAAIALRGTGGVDMISGGYIHHNYIHNNQADGYGYGVTLGDGGTALIEANYFDYCRHAIAGTGKPGDGYEARYNICGPNWIAPISPHNFDMHGYDTGSEVIAGDTIKIYNNTFMCTTLPMPTCIAVRGAPRDGAYIFNNSTFPA